MVTGVYRSPAFVHAVAWLDTEGYEGSALSLLVDFRRLLALLRQRNISREVAHTRDTQLELRNTFREKNVAEPLAPKGEGFFAAGSKHFRLFSPQY